MGKITRSLSECDFADQYWFVESESQNQAETMRVSNINKPGRKEVASRKSTRMDNGDRKGNGYKGRD